MRKRPPASSIGVYIACGEHADDAVILFGTPATDIPKLCARGSLKAKAVGPGVNIEKASGQVAGVRLYPRIAHARNGGYATINVREWQSLQKIIGRLRPTIDVLVRRMASLGKARRLKLSRAACRARIDH